MSLRSALFLVISFILFNTTSFSQSNNGIAVNQLASNIMEKYDANDNGELEVAEESFLREDLGDGVIKTESRGLLFTHADQKGDNNGVATFEELENYIGTFDTDHDSEITSFKNIFHSWFGGENEWDLFDEKYGERFSYNSQ